MRATPLSVAVALALLVVPASAAPPAPAPPVVETDADVANKLRLQGNEAMLAMRYSDALALYKQAAERAPKESGLHYSLARAYQFVGDYPAALGELERFDKEGSPEAKARVGALDTLYAQIRPRVATLKLACNVEGARVTVGDKIVGVTPLASVRLLAGATTLTVELDGYFPQSRDVTLPGQGTLELSVELHAKNNSGVLLVRSQPIGAGVLLDGRSVGTTNPTVELATSAGAHELTVQKEGFVDARVPIVLDAGARRDVSVPLEKVVPLTSRWWFWTGAGAVVLGGIATGIALTTERSPHSGTLTPGRVSGP